MRIDLVGKSAGCCRYSRRRQEGAAIERFVRGVSRPAAQRTGHIDHLSPRLYAHPAMHLELVMHSRLYNPCITFLVLVRRHLVVLRNLPMLLHIHALHLLAFVPTMATARRSILRFPCAGLRTPWRALTGLDPGEKLAPPQLTWPAQFPQCTITTCCSNVRPRYRPLRGQWALYCLIPATCFVLKLGRRVRPSTFSNQVRYLTSSHDRSEHEMKPALRSVQYSGLLRSLKSKVKGA